MEKVYGVHYFDGFNTKRTDLFNSLKEAKERQNYIFTGPESTNNLIAPIEVICTKERLIKIILDDISSWDIGICMNCGETDYWELIENYIHQKYIGWELLRDMFPDLA